MWIFFVFHYLYLRLTELNHFKFKRFLDEIVTGEVSYCDVWQCKLKTNIVTTFRLPNRLENFLVLPSSDLLAMREIVR